MWFVLPAPGELDWLQCGRHEGVFNPVGRHCNGQAVYGDPQSIFVCLPGPSKGHCRAVRGGAVLHPAGGRHV